MPTIRNIVKVNESLNTEELFQSGAIGVLSKLSTESNVEGLASSGREYFSQVSENYSSLSKGNKDGILAFVEFSEGTSWLPFTLGGTYYPSGLYIWDEAAQSWGSSRTKVAEGLSNASSGGVSSYNDLTDKPTIPTQITDSEITALGYVKTDNDTQLTDFDITALGYVKTDNNTQLSDVDISNFGYIKTFTDTNTQLSDSDITALGYIKTDTNTQLSDGDITALGYIKTDTNTQLTNIEVESIISTNTAGFITDAPDAGIGAGTYGNAGDAFKIDNITVDAQGRVTAVSVGNTGSGDVTDNSTTAFTNKSGSNSQWTNDEGYITSQISDAEITALGYIKSGGSTGVAISFFQVQDDGTTGQLVSSGYANVQGLWDTPTLTHSDFTFDATTGHLTTNVAGTIEIDSQLLAYSVLNNRVQLMMEIQKNGTTLVSDSNYATRNVTQRVGSTSINGFKDSCSIGDIYKLRVKRVGQEVSLGTLDASFGNFFSAKLYK